MFSALKRAAASWLTDGLSDEVRTLRHDNRLLQTQITREKERASGVKIRSGAFDIEFASALSGGNRWLTYQKMLVDPHVNGAVLQAALPLVNAEWTITPGGDQPRDREIADFVAANLLRKSCEQYGPDYWAQTSWQAQRLPEILDMLSSGFALFAKTWKQVGSQKVYDRLQWLEPSSVDPRGWDLDDSDNIRAIKRTLLKPSGELTLLDPLALEDLALYVWDFKGARYEGRPFLRSLYGPWFRKDYLQRQGMIWAQKVGSPPPWADYPNDYDENEAEEVKRFVRQLRGTAPEDSYGAFRQGRNGERPNFGYASTDAQEVDRIGSLIERENGELAHGAMTKTGMLGETQTGSRAVAGVMASIEFSFVQALGRIICEQETHGCANVTGLVEDLVRENFQGVTNFPRLSVGKIDPTEGLTKVDRVVAATAAGLVPKHPLVMKQVCAWLGIDLPDDALEEFAARQVVVPPMPSQDSPDSVDPNSPDSAPTEPDAESGAAPAQPKPGSPPAQAPQPENEPRGRRAASASLLTRSDVTARLAPLLMPIMAGKPASGGLRYPTKLEARFADLGAVKLAFRTGQDSILGELRRTHRAMVDEVLARVRNGKISRRSIESQRRSLFRGATSAKQALVQALRTTGESGMRQVAAELAKQSKASASLAAPKLAGKAMLPSVVKQFDDEIQVVSELNVTQMWQRVIGEGLGAYVRLQRKGLEGDALVKALQDDLEALSEKPLETMARHDTNVSYNEGRDVALRTAEYRGEAGYAVRTEILDEKTCATCHTLDGHVVEIGTPEYDELMPPNQCEGEENCRGFYLAVGDETLTAEE